MSMDREQIYEYAKTHIDIGNECDVLKDDCDIIEFMLDNCEITIPEDNRFFGRVNCGWITNSIVADRAENCRCLDGEDAITEGQIAGAQDGLYDIGHVTAEWESVIEFGIFGLRERLDEYAQMHKGDEKKKDFLIMLKGYMTRH